MAEDRKGLEELTVEEAIEGDKGLTDLVESGQAEVSRAWHVSSESEVWSRIAAGAAAMAKEVTGVGGSYLSTVLPIKDPETGADLGDWHVQLVCVRRTGIVGPAQGRC